MDKLEVDDELNVAVVKGQNDRLMVAEIYMLHYYETKVLADMDVTPQKDTNAHVTSDMKVT